MVLVDTSVWIDYFRGSNKLLVDRLNKLLDAEKVLLAAPVRVELLSGSKKHQWNLLNHVLSALPLEYPQMSTWKLIESWTEIAAAKGFHFGMGDLLIAAVAKENKARLWSLDNDFLVIKKLGFL